jgi:hypothetical protein
LVAVLTGRCVGCDSSANAFNFTEVSHQGLTRGWQFTTLAERGMVGMNQLDSRRLLAGLVAVCFGALGAFHLLTGFGGRAPWGFGLGFVTAALIFGFWGSSSDAEAEAEQHEDAPALDGIHMRLAALIDEGQEMLEKEKKAEERLALYNGA